MNEPAPDQNQEPQTASGRRWTSARLRPATIARLSALETEKSASSIDAAINFLLDYRDGVRRCREIFEFNLGGEGEGIDRAVGVWGELIERYLVLHRDGPGFNGRGLSGRTQEWGGERAAGDPTDADFAAMQATVLGAMGSGAAPGSSSLVRVTPKATPANDEPKAKSV